MKRLVLTSPAKVNLFLEILQKRTDGYHEICTVMQTIDLCDTLSFEQSSGSGNISISSEGFTIPIGPENLVCRALDLIRKKFSIRDGVHIHIQKRIPVGAGLGGGSSNAAAALRGANVLWDLGLSYDELQDIGANIGADVPFLVKGGTACCRGIGEQIEPLVFDGTLHYLLINPRFQSLTAEIYSGVKLPLTTKRRDPKVMIRALLHKDAAEIACALFNRLEEPAFEKKEELLGIKGTIHRCGALGAVLSGSGPTVFGVVESKEKAKQLKIEFEKCFFKEVFSIICSTHKGQTHREGSEL